MQQALDYIDRHLEDELDLDVVSRVAAFSKFYFHRQFTATFELSVHRYVQLAGMKRASYRLVYRDAESVTDIAMDVKIQAAPTARRQSDEIDSNKREFIGDCWRALPRGECHQI